jgi:hypothetical protein
MGPLNGVLSILGAARGLLTIADPPEHGEGQVHSVVVDETCRGEGLGGLIPGISRRMRSASANAGRSCR